MSLLKILILSVVQGFSELLPISSSAHVIVAEKLMGLDPTRPDLTLLLVMLHAGTTLSVLVYYWDSWKSSFFSSRQDAWNFAGLVGLATACTCGVGWLLIDFIEKFALKGTPHAQIEDIFGNLALMGIALGATGIFILVSGLRQDHSSQPSLLGLKESLWIGGAQGLCLPFRGFSRSGATISTGLMLGGAKRRVEEFSFALAAVISPLAILWETWRLFTAPNTPSIISLAITFFLSLLGLVMSFVTGLLALKWLSNWLARGRWPIFGLYCLFFAALVQTLSLAGF